MKTDTLVSCVKHTIAFAALLAMVLTIPPKTFAISCTGLPAIGSIVLSNCTLTVSSVTGADQANNIELSSANSAVLTLNPGASVTINSGGTLAAGSVALNGGTIAIDNGGFTKANTPIYITDADADGWPDEFTQSTATAGGLRRLSLMRSATTTDCSGSEFSQTNTCLIVNGGACTADNQCVSGICGTNADGDSYFSSTAGHTGVCQGGSLPYTDCYDANATVYPGSATCMAVDRGDGSFDYNCSSSESTCGSPTYDYACGSVQLTNDYCSGTTCAANTVTGYTASATACGQVGCRCTNSATTRGTSCSAVGGLYPSCSIPTTTTYCSAVSSGSQPCQ